jgi:hypothetical protein
VAAASPVARELARWRWCHGGRGIAGHQRPALKGALQLPKRVLGSEGRAVAESDRQHAQAAKLAVLIIFRRVYPQPTTHTLPKWVFRVVAWVVGLKKPLRTKGFLVSAEGLEPSTP